jgi:cell division protein FtsB
MENYFNNKNKRPLLRRGLGRVPAWIKSKYFISFAAFAAILLFFDKNDLFTQYARSRELKKLQQSKEYYTSHIQAERKELEQLKNDPAMLEKYAREKYLMKRDNEELFVVPEKYGIQKK